MELPKRSVDSLEQQRVSKWEVYHVPLAVMTYLPVDAESLTRAPNCLHVVRDGSITRNNDIALAGSLAPNLRCPGADARAL